MNETPIRIAISTCLMGKSVRYNGGHKKDAFLLNTFGQYFEYVPVCPEVECGMAIPRESMRLEGTPENYRLITHKTKTDKTAMMQSWGEKRLIELAPMDLCGYIFKSKSPSSGLHRVKIYSADSSHIWHNGRGIWADMFTRRFPLIPVEEDGRLHDPGLRENFIEKVFVFRRWRDLLKSDPGYGDLVDFHTRHKLLIMSHDVPLYRSMGKLVGEGRKEPFPELLETYLSQLLQAMDHPGTVKKHINVLQHIMGYFKSELSSDEKQELLDLLDQYRNGNIPLIVPVTMLNHYVRKYGEEYLAEQWYLHPHPVEMKLRTYI